MIVIVFPEVAWVSVIVAVLLEEPEFAEISTSKL